MDKTTKPLTKTAFILSFSNDTPAKDIVAKGREKGIKLTDKLVYAIRSSAKAKKAKGSATPKKRASTTADGEQLRAVFLKLVERIGADKAISIILDSLG